MSFLTNLSCFNYVNHFKKLVFLVSSLPVVAYADGQAITTMLRQTPVISSFDMCYGGGCAAFSHVSLSDADWQAIIKNFESMPKNAAEERTDIANAIGTFEQIVGAKTGTSEDKGGTFGNSAYPNQLDCNDEAANTTIYMRLLNNAGFLHYHQIMDTKTRGFFLNGWPHTTAVIKENVSKDLYAVDSWFYDNGKPATVVPFALWKSGWKPEKTIAH